MNVQQLEQGVVDVSDYINQYLYAKDRGGDVGTLDIDADLYDRSTAQPREFLLVLASRITDQFDINNVQVKDVRAQKSATSALYVLAIVLAVVVPVVAIVFYGVALRRRALHHIAIDWPRQALYVLGVGTLTVSVFTLLILKFRTDKRVLSHVRLVDLQSQVPNTQLLWDPSVRLIYYNVVPEGAETRIAKDPALAQDCLDDGPPPTPGANAHLNIQTLGSGICKRRVPQLTDAYLTELLRWIKDFYGNRGRILFTVRSLDPDGMARSIVAANATLSQLIYTSSNRRPARFSARSTVDNVVAKEILPLLTADYKEVKGVKATTGTPTKTIDGHGFLNKQNCIDDCVVKNAGSCQLVAVGADQCRTYGKGVVLEPALADDDPSGSVIVGKNANLFVLAPAGDRVQSTLPGPGFASISECLEACSGAPACQGCHVASRGDKATMVALSGAAAATGPRACSSDCLYVKTAAAALPGDATDTAALLDGRREHLAARLADAYVRHGIAPKDAYWPTMNALQSTTGSSFAQLQPSFDAILKRVEAVHVDQTTSRFYVTDSVLVNKLGKMTRAELVTGLLRPIYQLKVSATVLNRRLHETAAVALEKWHLTRAAVRMAVGNLVIFAAIGIAWLVYARRNEPVKEDDAYEFYLKTSVLVAAVVFAGTLALSVLHKTSTRMQASQSAVLHVGSRLSANIETIAKYVEQQKAWVGALLGLPRTWTYDPYTFDIIVRGKVVDVTAPLFRRQTLNMTTLDSDAAIVSDLRTLLISLDGTINNCQDLLALRPGTTFPTNEVLLLVAGIAVALVTFMYATAYLKPGLMLDRLRRLVRQRADQDYSAILEMDDSGERAAHMTTMGGAALMLLALSWMAASSARDYVVAGADACRKSRPSP